MIGKMETLGRPVIWTSHKLGPDLKSLPSGSTFPILNMTPWKILYFYLQEQCKSADVKQKPPNSKTRTSMKIVFIR